MHWGPRVRNGVGNVFMGLHKCDFRAFVHPVADIESVATGAGRNALAEAIFFFGVFSYADANKYNDALVRDWVDKGFSEVQILRPGRTLTRFLYFRVGQDFAPSGATLRVPFERDSRGSREVAVLRF